MTAMKKTLWFWLYFILAIILAVYFATRIIMTGMGRGDNAHIHHITVFADTNTIDLSPVVAAAAIAPNTKTYHIDLDQLNARIISTPGIRASATRRIPNGDISVRVKVYHAVALWTDGELYYPLSADGTIVQRPTDTRDMTAVLFRGELPDNLNEITKAAHNLISDLDYLEWIEGRRWDIYTRDGIRIMLPEKTPADAIAQLILLNKNYQIFARDVHVIDMRDSARILIK